MRRSISGIVVGIMFIMLGLVVALKVVGISLNIFFDGWWTLFIIIPCFFGMLKKNDRSSNAIGFGIGVLLFCLSRGYMGWGVFGRLAGAIIFVVIGFSMLARRSYRTSYPVRTDEFREDSRESNIGNNTSRVNGNGVSQSVLLSGQSVSYDGQVFNGGNFSATLGSLQIDLRGAYVEEDVFVDAVCLLAGIDIYAPDNINIVVNATPILGGVDNKVRRNPDAQHTIYINATCILGGIDIK